MRVPERWDSPADSIDLSVVRIPAADSAAVDGTAIVYLAGGPGGSAISAAGGDRWPLFEGLRQAGDVLLMDQRGTVGAEPFLLCPSGLDAPLSTPGTRERLLSMWTEWSRACVSSWADSGVDLAAYETESAARDLEALRRRLELNRIDLVAVSYGTQLAQAYARAFPEGVGRVVLAGPEPLAATLKPIAQTEAQLARLDSAVAADPAASQAVGSFTGLIRKVLENLERAPVSVPVVDPLTGDATPLVIGDFDVRFLIAFVLGDRDAMRRLPALLLGMKAGDYSRVAPLVVRLRRFNGTAMSVTTDCASLWDPRRAARNAAADSSLLRDAANFPYPDICAHWPRRVPGTDTRGPFRSGARTLFIAGTMDGRTPPANIELLSPMFPDSHILLLEGGAHDDDLFLGSPAIVPAIVEFLRGGDVPRHRVLRLQAWRFPV